MLRNRFLALATAAAVGGLIWTSVAHAGDEAPAAPAKAAPATAEAPKTKTSTPIWSVMSWVGKQVAPDLECACPSTEAGEKAWRSWFGGGKDVALASLRDQMVADGWSADRFVTFFKDMAAKKAASGCPCEGGACKEKGGDCCNGSGERADGKPCCGGCKKKDPAATPAPAPAPKPEEASKP